MADLKDLQKLLLKTAVEMPDIAIKVVKVEGLKFIKHNFKNEGFNTGSGIKKWEKRKTLDKSGRNITRYRTNRIGKPGRPNKYGRSITGRAILVGHKTAGDKLTNSFIAVKKSKHTVAFRTYKKYGQQHNEGLNGMPKRQFIGPSKYLDKEILKKLKREHDKRLK
ncbi:phage morphogenesis protein [Tenacibaculum pacificus]|uniref:phage morphogenesis protein n=1 Tax=Tenacibaculum TaxID=104267 RepID=UPI0022F3D1D5|nr:phage morphogenesis protein [Tenacibaculum pacificus]WBX72909.1 phage morphogenesis protein [Tenacibaculum pacificus]